MMTKLIPRIRIKLLRTDEFMPEVSNNLINSIVLIELMIIKMASWTIHSNQAHQEDQEGLEDQEDPQMMTDMDLVMKD